MQEPFLPAVLRAVSRYGENVDVEPLLTHWQSRATGTPLGPDRYRWELTHARGTKSPDYAGPPAAWQAWHASEQTFVDRDVHAFEARLSLPLVLCESIELLAEQPDAATSNAQELIVESEPVLRRDFASFIQARHAWTDTFALWVLTRYPRTFDRLHPIAVALAETYAAGARQSDGLVLGSRFPFHEQPLASCCAHLASSLLHLGMQLDLVVSCAAFVKASRRESGGWGDGDDPTDLLTTLVAAKLLSSTDPSFDPGPTARFFVEHQMASGLWKALGPEAPWLTAAVEHWLDSSERSFGERFAWPDVHTPNLDRKTKLPFFAAFADLALLFETLDGLRETSTQLAFIDLAGFRDFNTGFGQDMGDQVLELFALELRRLSNARAIRDGGDEFLVVGAPTSAQLLEHLEALRAGWPSVFEARFGKDVPTVAPRILVTSVGARRLMEAREALGMAISPFKKRAPAPSPEGVLEVIQL